MKRRTFIQMVGASTLGLPFMYAHVKPGAWKAVTQPSVNAKRTPLNLHFSVDESGIFSVLQRRSEGVYLVGGGVLAKAAKAELPYVNLLVDCAQFTALKNDLFGFGVQPVSTPELPANFIRFLHGGKPWSVANLKLETFLSQNVLSPRLKLVPLAHNFLVYSSGERWVLDPYAAFDCRGRIRSVYRIKRLQEPDNPVAGLELCLAIAFDNALLGLEFPAGHGVFEKNLLASTLADERCATTVFHQALSFFPDLVELKGWDLTRRYLLSPLCLSAAAAGPAIDLRAVDASLRRLESRGVEVTSAHLMSAIDSEVQKLEKTPGLGIGLSDYLAAKRLPVRRGDLMAEVMLGKPTTA